MGIFDKIGSFAKNATKTIGNFSDKVDARIGDLSKLAGKAKDLAGGVVSGMDKFNAATGGLAGAIPGFNQVRGGAAAAEALAGKGQDFIKKAQDIKGKVDAVTGRGRGKEGKTPETATGMIEKAVATPPSRPPVAPSVPVAPAVAPSSLPSVRPTFAPSQAEISDALGRLKPPTPVLEKPDPFERDNATGWDAVMEEMKRKHRRPKFVNELAK